LFIDMSQIVHKREIYSAIIIFMIKVKYYQNDGLMTVRFSIGAKMIILISFIVILSLGSITALASWLFTGDLRISAEENNFEANHSAAMEAQMMLENVIAHSKFFIKAVTADGANSNELSAFFFTENPQIMSVFYFIQGKPEQIFINNEFLVSREIEVQTAASYLNSQRDVLGRAVRGETLLLNCAPYFGGPLLALFFQWQDNGAGAVVFSSENLNQNFGFGTNQSYMINSMGDLLSHTEFSLVQMGVNVSNEKFINSILESPQKNKQQLIDSETKQFVAHTRLDIAGAVVITGIEYDKVFEGIAATTRRNLYLTAAVLSISIILIWFFAKTISVPIKELAGAAYKIEGGEFDMEMIPKGRDEIGVLTNSFNKMCKALQVFGRFTNREIAVKAMRGEIKPGGLTKHATIFFSDIRGFTAKSENFTKVFGEKSSDLIVHWLNDYFTQMIECVEKTNGVIDKFIGDAVMAHWGTAYSAGSSEKDAYNCVKAALMMRNVLFAMNKKRRNENRADNPPIQIGCGINTGIVTAGQLGSEKRMEYTVIGDPVNIASRIESLTKSLGADILISEDTWKLVGTSFITEEMPSVTVKGKEKPLRLFAVINIAGSNKGPQTLSDVRKTLGISIPDTSNINIIENEIKYSIIGKQEKK